MTSPAIWRGHVGYGVLLVLLEASLGGCEARPLAPSDDGIAFGDGDGDPDGGDPGDGDPGDGDGDPGDGDGDGPVTCTPIVESLVITDETELASVACVEVVLGDLTVGPTTQLIDLRALGSLREVGGTAAIVGNLSLTTLDGLQALESVDWLHIRRNRHLSDLAGLDGLVAVERISIIDDDGLTSLAGLPDGLAPSTIEIADNELLPSLAGLPSFATASTQDARLIEVAANPSLVEVEGLSSCCLSQPLDLILSDNDALPDLDGLEGFARLERLRLFDNDALANLAGLDGLVELGTLDIEYDHCDAVASGLVALAGAPNLVGLDVLQIQWAAGLASLDGVTGISTLSKLLIRNNDALAWTEVVALEAQTSPPVVDTCGGAGGPACPPDPCSRL